MILMTLLTLTVYLGYRYADEIYDLNSILPFNLSNNTHSGHSHSTHPSHRGHSHSHSHGHSHGSGNPLLSFFTSYHLTLQASINSFFDSIPLEPLYLFLISAFITLIASLFTFYNQSQAKKAALKYQNDNERAKTRKYLQSVKNFI